MIIFGDSGLKYIIKITFTFLKDLFNVAPRKFTFMYLKCKLS